MSEENEEKKEETRHLSSSMKNDLKYPPGLNITGKEEKTDNVHPKVVVRNKISISYGLIVFTYSKEGEKMFLMTQRRDTFSYECILRGLYTNDILEEYVNNTTKEERARFYIHNFDTLWKDLWVSTKRRLYRLEYKKAKELYEHNLDLILLLLSKNKDCGKAIWEFPKGKLFSEETTYQCALREFEEETHIKKSNVSIIKEAGHYDDNYEGTDHNMYRSVYYLGYIPRGTDIKINYLQCPWNVRSKYISDEVMDLKWFTVEQTLALCSPSKQQIIQSILKFLE
jgi:ADP-ribose pyrophosphatase YjhB (NUDIX family)